MEDTLFLSSDSVHDLFYLKELLVFELDSVIAVF